MRENPRDLIPTIGIGRAFIGLQVRAQRIESIANKYFTKLDGRDKFFLIDRMCLRKSSVAAIDPTPVRIVGKPAGHRAVILRTADELKRIEGDVLAKMYHAGFPRF